MWFRKVFKMTSENYSIEDYFSSEKSVYDSLHDSYHHFMKYIKESSKSLKESFFAIFLSILTDVLAGLFLGKLEETLLLLPGLIILIPGAMGMRGHVFGSLGSRLGSALHIGSIDNFTFKNKIIKNNFYASLTLTIFTSVFLGFVAYALLIAFGFKAASPLSLMLISFLGGIASGIILIFITFGIAILSHRKGWDPDNVTSPLITALGDFFTIPTLALSAFFILGLPGFYIILASVFVIALAVIDMIIVFKGESTFDMMVMRDGSKKKIVMQSVIVMMFAGILSALSGVMLEHNITAITAVPIILTLLPAFLEEGGNIGNILSSRISTKLHIGAMDANFKVDKSIKREFVVSYLLTVMVFPIVGVLSYALGLLIGIGGMSFSQTILVSLIAGLMMTTVVIISTFFISIIAYRMKINPDNVTIPMITGIADILGVFSLIFVLGVFGVI